MTRAYTFLIIILSSCLILGCAKKEEPKKPGIDDILQQAEALENAGNIDAAVSLLECAIGRPSDDESKHMLLTRLLFMQLYAKRYNDAEALAATMVRDVPSLADNALTQVGNYYTAAQEFDRLIPWAKKLIEPTSLPERQAQGYRWLFEVYQATDQTDSVRELVPECIKALPAAAAANTLNLAVVRDISHARYDEAQVLVATIANVAGNITPLKYLVITSQSNIFTARQQWDQLVPHVDVMLEELPDQQLVRPLSRALSSALKQNKGELADKICRRVLDRDGFPQAQRVAAGFWVSSALKQEAFGEVPIRLEELFKQKLSIDQVLYPRFREAFYPVMHTNDRDIQARMIAFADTLLKEDLKESVASALNTLILDGAVMMEDYDRALVQIERETDPEKKEWVKLATAKGNAHKALAEGRPREAVTLFREFMTLFEEQTKEPLVDPITNIQHSPEMILGRNAKRIAEILTSVKDKDGAEAAREEAKTYYNKALKSVKPDTPEQKLILSELEALAG